MSPTLTKVFEQLALVAALPADTSLLRPHHFPGPQIHSPFFGSVLEEDSIAEESKGTDCQKLGIATAHRLGGKLIVHCGRIAGGPQVQGPQRGRLRDRVAGGGG